MVSGSKIETARHESIKAHERSATWSSLESSGSMDIGGPVAVIACQGPILKEASLEAQNSRTRSAAVLPLTLGRVGQQPLPGAGRFSRIRRERLDGAGKDADALKRCPDLAATWPRPGGRSAG